jgi:tetratricopeptide (TPR) repeat protein
MGQGLTPLPGNTGTDASSETKPVVVPAAKPLEVAPPVPVFARYNYFSPHKPAPGDRTAASGAFTKARVFEQDEKWTDALQWYQQAAGFDPSWFEAQYNTGVLAHRLRNYATALPRYELALAVQPDSTDARYNFALALKAAGYAPDAAEQLKILLASQPGEVRAHLALANISAQSLRDNAQAREHYLKVMELDPANPQASDIRFWLSANPK